MTCPLKDLPRNMMYAGIDYVEECNAEMHHLSLTEIPAERWNAMAAKNNTEAFKEKFGRDPVNYPEVLDWVNSYRN